MSPSSLAQRLPLPPSVVRTGLVAILRAPTSAHLEAAALVLIDAGVTAIEVTLTTPGAVDVIAALAARVGGDVAIGAGTVLTADDVRRVVGAGATFVVSPGSRAEMVAAAREAGVATLIGAYTPTEVFDVWSEGASAVKLFPAATGGPAHLASVRDPFPSVDVVPSGGIRVDAIADYLRAGAAAVGVGGPLCGDALLTGELGGLRARAAAALAQVEIGRAR